ncbi:hypothetical protein PEPS_28190 (plasmid) [Persicobacter psychrovividus]|uniref:Uncharacterized protein n=1 Tax=Persicobacter psychrovividus TaxID=387638 RepID=A0ABM7VHT7_9BACT|nr:hypothetical protein PEPS_28190 [Persicobacter psychrovividus]
MVKYNFPQSSDSHLCYLNYFPLNSKHLSELSSASVNLVKGAPVLRLRQEHLPALD